MSGNAIERFREKVAESYEQGFIHPTIDVSKSIADQFRRMIAEEEQSACINKAVGISDEVVLYDLDEDYGISKRHLSVNLNVSEEFSGAKLCHPKCIYCNNVPFTRADGEFFCPVCD